LILREAEKRSDMTLVIILNVILCAAVIVGVVAPLIWAIVTQHHHETEVVQTERGVRQRPARAARRRRRGLLEPIIWPSR
jgi:ABC-type glycerol-3-phosphate transport system permease component